MRHEELTFIFRIARCGLVGLFLFGTSLWAIDRPAAPVFIKIARNAGGIAVDLLDTATTKADSYRTVLVTDLTMSLGEAAKGGKTDAKSGAVITRPSTSGI